MPWANKTVLAVANDRRDIVSTRHVILEELTVPLEGPTVLTVANDRRYIVF